ncbi:testis-expressed protein 48-like [Balaenoptera acutorostrata]|uniref:Testis-expressed protein 48-like n=1 Tax=Balaenoptera acutorostrata TaxID=9767 RepID=A0ABM3TT83_BALAC|nr:testis-expressed protein 48-like [Balaenoptera acutorostrata]
MAAHQNLASKIFCLCCKCCEEPNATDDSKIPSQPQELQPSKHDVNSHVSKRGFHKRNPSRYSQDRWPYQPCLIGRP